MKENVYFLVNVHKHSTGSLCYNEFINAPVFIAAIRQISSYNDRDLTGSEIKDNTVKPVLSGHLKKDKTKVLMENGSLRKVKSIAECSTWSILQYFRPALSDNRY